MPSETFDISADLGELAESNVAVVTAGAKAILDLALTLERLETLGVPVVGFGTDAFPAFYSRESGLKVPMRADTPEEVAAIMRAKWRMGFKGGLVIANPIPAEHEIPASEIARVIDERAGRRQGASDCRQGRDAVPARRSRQGDEGPFACRQYRARRE